MESFKYNADSAISLLYLLHIEKTVCNSIFWKKASHYRNETEVASTSVLPSLNCFLFHLPVMSGSNFIIQSRLKKDQIEDMHMQYTVLSELVREADLPYT